MSVPARPPAVRHFIRHAAAVLCGLLSLQAGAAGLRPSAMFAQAGVADHADSLTVGLDWDWAWHRSLGRGEFTGYWEASIGRWHSQDSAEWVTQVGLTPVVRWRPGGWADGWWLEAGIGLNSLVPIYRNGGKQFSTVFNFGDHLALVRQFGAARDNEVSLRWQHYSNAGIRQPNPGENFVQLRYARRF